MPEGFLLHDDERVYWPGVSTWANFSVLEIPKVLTTRFTDRFNKAKKYTVNVALLCDVQNDVEACAARIIECVAKYDNDLFVWLRLGKDSILNRTFADKLLQVSVLLDAKAVRHGVAASWEYEYLMPAKPYMALDDYSVRFPDMRCRFYVKRIGSLFKRLRVCVASKTVYEKVF